MKLDTAPITVATTALTIPAIAPWEASPSSTLFGPESFCPTRMKKRFSYYVSKEQLHNFFFFNSSYKIRGHLMMKKIFYPYNIQLSGIQTFCFQSTGHGYSNFNLGRSALLQMRAAHLWSLINSPTTSGVNSVLEVVKVHSCTQGMMTNSAGWSQWPSLYWDAP